MQQFEYFYLKSLHYYYEKKMTKITVKRSLCVIRRFGNPDLVLYFI